MRKADRPLPLKRGTQARRDFIENALKYKWATTRRQAHKQANAINHKARQTPLPGEKCGARCKQSGLPCKAPANSTGRCKHHGGSSSVTGDTQKRNAVIRRHIAQGHCVQATCSQ